VAKIIERVHAHYDVQEVEMGKVYRWCPAKVSFECTCGEKPTLSANRTTCGECGADHATIVGEVLHTRPEDKGDHPWRYLQPHTLTWGT
jgi:hypothetical protein